MQGDHLAPQVVSMKTSFVLSLIFVLPSLTNAHDDDHNDQMPLEYVKYPYQAVYPGDNEGTLRPVSSAESL